MSARVNPLRGVRRLVCWCCALLLAGISCKAVAIVKAERILSAAADAITLLQGVQTLTAGSSSELRSAMTELRSVATTPNVPRAQFGNLEERLSKLRSGSRALEQRLDDAKGAIDGYLDLLETRAEQNKTTELRESLLSDIGKRRSALAEHVARAEGAIQRLETAIQKYDDVLGYLQVREGLKVADEQLKLIDGVIADASLLNAQVDAAVLQGIAIIKAAQGDELVAPPPGEREAPPPLVSGCAADCSGGVDCPTPATDARWCAQENCACPSGLRCLAGKGEEKLAGQEPYFLRFSRARPSKDDDECALPLEPVTCLRRSNHDWRCHRQDDACSRRTATLGSVSADGFDVELADFTTEGLEISVWTRAPDQAALAGLEQKRIPPGLLAWQQGVRHPGGLKRNALCTGTFFSVRGMNGQRDWYVSVFLNAGQ